MKGVCAAVLVGLIGAGCPAEVPPGVADADVKADTDADAHADADAVAVADADADADADAVPDAVADAVTDADADAVTDADADAVTDADVVVGVDADADAVISPMCVSAGALCQPPFFITCQEGRCNDDLECVNVPIDGCCIFPSDCDLSLATGCNEMRCVSQACTLVARPGCCDAQTPCDYAAACTDASCVDGRCQVCPTDGATCSCPTNPVLASQGFENLESINFSGFFASDFQQDDNVVWALTTKRWARPPAALYLGDPLCRTYYSGPLGPDCQPLGDGSGAPQVRLVLYSPVINLGLPGSSGAGKVAMFMLWADVEEAAGLADALQIAVDDLSGVAVTWPTVTSEVVGKDTQGQWRLIAIDLAPYEGKSVRLRMEFDTLDGQDNLHEGLYLDDWQVVDRCAGGGCCTSDADCVSLSPSDPCVAARCIALSDGGGQVCATVAATPGEPCQACAVDGDCDDGNPCTADTCAPGGTCSNAQFCCFEQDVFAASFDDGDGLTGWQLDDEQPLDAASWQVTSALTAVDGGSALWFGDPATATYATGAHVRAAALTPVFELPDVPADPGVDDATIGAEFWVHLTTEWSGAADYVNPLGLDRLSVSVVTANGSVEVWSSDEIVGSTGGAWLPVAVDLTLFAGQPVQLAFTFDSVDGENNAFQGPLVDAIRAGRRCP